MSLLVFILVAGCSGGPVRPVCFPVQGKVLFENQPLSEARLIFHPVRGELVPQPTAVTSPDGQFQLATWADKDGAPAGDYIVTVVYQQLVQQGEEKVRSGKNLLPVLYADPRKSPLRATVKEGSNTLPAFELKR